MKHAGYLSVGFTLMLAAGFSLFTGCGAGQKTGLSVKSKKGGANMVTLSGYSGIVNNTGLSLEDGTNQRLFKTDPPDRSNQGVLEIKEKMFITQTNDVYLNPEDYIGRTLKLEGVFVAQQDYTMNGTPYYFVIRNGPGCCVGDGSAGFEVMWENGTGTYPQENDWVEAVGVLGSYEEDGYPYLCINLSSLTVLEKRGAEFVTQ